MHLLNKNKNNLSILYFNNKYILIINNLLSSNNIFKYIIYINFVIRILVLCILNITCDVFCPFLKTYLLFKNNCIFATAAKAPTRIYTTQYNILL